MSHWINITRNGKSELIELETNAPKTLPLDKELNYQILDEQGNPLPLQIIENADQVEVYLPNRKTPILILQNESQLQAVVKSGNTVSLNEVTLATEVITESSSFSTLAYIGGGLAALGGIAFALGGNSSKGGSPAPLPSTQKPNSHTSNKSQPDTKQDNNHLNAEAAEATRKQAEEAEKARLQAEAEEAALKQAEEQEKARLQAETEENAPKQAAEQEKARLQAEAEERARKQTEEQEKARLQAEAEENTRKQAEEQEKARLQAEAEEHARKQAEEQEKARLQAEAEEHARKQAEEAEKARLQAEAEEAARKQAEEAEKTRLQAEAEEHARKQAEEQEKARLQAEAEEHARKQAEEQEKARLQAEAEENARKQAEEQEKVRLQAEAEETAHKQAEEQEKARLQAEAEENARKQAEEQEKARLQAEAEETARKQAEEAEKARLQAEAEEAARKQDEEAEKARLQEEAEEATRKLPELSFHNITGDDIINAEEAKQLLVVSGTVKNLQENDRLSLKIGDVSYSTTVENGIFIANVDGKTLASHALITAEVVRGQQQIEVNGNTHQVQVKTDLPTTPAITFEPITSDNIINLTESQQDQIAISGSVENAQEGDEVIVSCGCPTCTGTQWVDIKTKVQAGKFSVNFAGEQLAKEGYTIVKAQVITADQYGNQALGQAEHSYKVDIEPPQPSLIFNPISAINQSTADTINVSGRVLNLKTDETGTVTATIGNQSYTAPIQNGQYHFKVPKAQFANGNKVALRLNVQDIAGNSAELTESSHIQDQDYVYDVTLNKPVILLNEPQSLNTQTPVVLSGTLDYDNDVLPSSVKVGVHFNGTDYPAQINGHQWQVILPATTAGTHQLTLQASVSDKVGNHAENTLRSSITIEAPATPPQTDSQTEISITYIGEQEQGDMVRIGGKLNLSDLAAKYKNAMQIHELALTLNHKTYYAGVDSQQHFNLEIPYSDLVEAQGQTLHFTLNGDPIYSLEAVYGRNNFRLADNVVHHKLPNITANDITFEQNNYFQADKVVTHLPEKTTTITGSISGEIEEGNIVSVKVGEQRFNAEVSENKAFSLTLPTSVLKANTSGQISAELRKTENGEVIASTEERYHSGRLLNSELVATYEHSQKDKPYFLTALSYEEPRMDSYLSRTFNYKETLNLTYSFFEPSIGYEGYKYAEINQANRDQARKIFDLYSRYANVKFSQTEHTSGDITYYLHDNTAGNNAMHGGRVLFGGRNGQNQDTHRDWSKESFWHLFTHETFHSFGAKHAHQNGVVLPALEDQTSLSVMTYRTERMNLSDYDLKIYDLIYLHFRFGVNPDQRSGNDVYSFKDFDRQRVDGNVYIWDGGGVDTFDASAEKEAVFVDLTPGSWIYRGQKTDNFIIESSKQILIDDYFAGASEYRSGNTLPTQGEFTNLFEHQFSKGQAYIGYGTQIERLIGSAFNDELKGNVADNDIFGGNGNDKIWGGAGNDYLHGGNGNDYLNGGLRQDTLVGGKGEDTFAFDSLLGHDNLDTILDFDPTEDKIALSASIFSNLTSDNIRTHIQYDTESGQLSYNNTAFAELQTGLSIEQIQFEII